MFSNFFKVFPDFSRLSRFSMCFKDFSEFVKFRHVAKCRLKSDGEMSQFEYEQMSSGSKSGPRISAVNDFRYVVWTKPL